MKELQGNSITMTKQGSDKLERSLISQIVMQDELAFENLYHLYHDRLCRFMFRICGSNLSANIPDIINEVMYVVWNKADTFTFESRVSTWIFGIAFNIARKTLACEGRYQQNQDAFSTVQPEEIAVDWVSQYELDDWLTKSMQSLSADHRIVVELAYFQGLHYKEISQIVDCPENTVKTRMYHARCKLAEALRHKSLPDSPAKEVVPCLN